MDYFGMDYFGMDYFGMDYYFQLGDVGRNIFIQMRLILVIKT
jgi:hypothetical protein